MKTDTETLDTIIRYYLQGRIYKGLSIVSTGYSEDKSGTLEIVFKLHINGVKEASSEPKRLSSLITETIEYVFGENEFANAKRAEIVRTNDSLLAQKEELRREIEKLRPYESYYNLALQMTHPKK